jgi:hypothetical protein
VNGRSVEVLCHLFPRFLQQARLCDVAGMGHDGKACTRDLRTHGQGTITRYALVPELFGRHLKCRQAKMSWRSYAGVSIILALRGMGRHPCRETHAFVPPTRWGSMAAVIVGLWIMGFMNGTRLLISDGRTNFGDFTVP